MECSLGTMMPFSDLRKSQSQVTSQSHTHPRHPMSKFLSVFRRNWLAIEAIPLYAVVGIAVGGAGWYITRLATRPDIIWTKSNPTPWNSVGQNDNVKLMTGNHQFEKSWKRDKL